MKAEIISIGTELLLGEITDTNAAYLASQLPLLGIDLHFISTVGDNKQRLIETLNHAWQRSDIIITTGGLGPTDDDITRESIADFFKESIAIDASLVTQFKETFRHFNMNMPESNVKQASVIPSAQIIANPRGTAPGWWIERDEHVMIAMPGPPGEMQLMWSKVVLPRLQDKFCNSVIFSKTLKVFGISEAKVGELTSRFLLASNPTVGIYARQDGVHLRITAKAAELGIAQKLVNHTAREIESILGEIIWGTDSDTLEGVIAQILLSKGMTLSTLEAGTGGALANMITNSPDSPKFYKHGTVINQDDLLTESSINSQVISNYGTVSEETACEMAVAARNKYRTSVGIGLIGIVDINESKYSPGSVMVGIADDKRTYSLAQKMPGTRKQIKQWAAISALFELRKILRH